MVALGLPAPGLAADPSYPCARVIKAPVAIWDPASWPGRLLAFVRLPCWLHTGLSVVRGTQLSTSCTKGTQVGTYSTYSRYWGPPPRDRRSAFCLRPIRPSAHKIALPLDSAASWRRASVLHGDANRRFQNDPASSAFLIRGAGDKELVGVARDGKRA